MKAITNGTRYDTDKSTEIGSYHNGKSPRDFGHWKASLYITPRSSKYFLAGTGGPMSQFSHPAGNMTSGGSKLIPLDKQDAFEWAEQYLETEIVEHYFADMISD